MGIKDLQSYIEKDGSLNKVGITSLDLVKTAWKLNKSTHGQVGWIFCSLVGTQKIFTFCIGNFKLHKNNLSRGISIIVVYTSYIPMNVSDMYAHP